MIIWYRVSKYNPINRDSDGRYLGDDWSSYSDFYQDSDIVNWDVSEYYITESKYIEMIRDTLKELGVDHLQIIEYEKYANNLPWRNKINLPIESVLCFACDCLREKCWGKLKGKKIEIHFGYDYYMYMGVCDNDIKLEEIALKYNLFIENVKSPYIN